MFVIHRDQVEGFATLRRAAFEGEAARILAARTGREPSLEALRASIARALARHIENEPEVLQYVALELIAGGELSQRWPWAAEVLARSELLPIGKLRVLVRTATAHGHDTQAIDFLGAWR